MYVTPQIFKDAPKLKLIQMLSAGYDRADLDAARKSKVPLCANGGANSVAVSEHAMLLMLAVSRRIITQHTNVTAGRWHGNAPPTVHEVRNRVLGIVGLMVYALLRRFRLCQLHRGTCELLLQQSMRRQLLCRRRPR